MHRAFDGVAVLEAAPPESPVHQLAGEILADLAAAHLGTQLTDDDDPMLAADVEKRWKGWKLAYGADNQASASEANALATTAWHDLLEGRSFFEDAVHRLAKTLGA